MKAVAFITPRSVLLGAATAALLNLYTNYTSLAMGASALTLSQFPLAGVLPFTGWLILNVGLKAFFPKAALTGTELLVIFSMSWIAGGIPLLSWAAYWVSTVATPTYYASPENRWEEVLFDILPWWCLPEASPEVIRPFFEGVPPGGAAPWEGWFKPLFWWSGGAAAMLTSGVCLSVLFRRQWEESERLSFPLAQFAVGLTEGFDEPGRVPRIFRDRVFWAGFLAVFGVILWNVAGYFAAGMPRVTLYDNYLTKQVNLARNFPPVYLRVMPPVVGLTYFCHLDILFSFWALELLAVLKIGLIDRMGLGVGLSGQQAPALEIVDLESHGAMVLLVAWSVWVARDHLRRVWRTAWATDRPAEEEEGGSYRIALVGLAASTVFVVGFFRGLGMTLPVAVLQTLLLYIACFTLIKFIAASGFPYLFTVGGWGGSLLKTFVGTSPLSPGDFVGVRYVNHVFFGDGRLPAWPALPHHFKLLGRRRGLVWIAALAFFSGMFASFLGNIYLAYSRGGQNLHGAPFHPQGPSVLIYDRMVSDIMETHRTVFDPGKMVVWGLGAAEAGLLVALRNRFPWWPVHPLGLAFQYTWGPQVYSFSIFLTWFAKLLLLRIGGIGLYRRAAPFFIGLALGYVVGVGTSAAVDFIWFPDGGHPVHTW